MAGDKSNANGKIKFLITFREIQSRKRPTPKANTRLIDEKIFFSFICC